MVDKPYPLLMRQDQEVRATWITVNDRWGHRYHEIEVNLEAPLRAQEVTAFYLGMPCALVRPRHPDVPMQITALSITADQLHLTARWGEELGRLPHG